MSNRFKQSVVDCGSFFTVLTYDLQKEAFVEPLCEYAKHLSIDECLARLTVVQEMGHLRVFWAYLVARASSIDAIDDRLLRRFRARTRLNVFKSPSHRGTRSRAEETVNAKLIRIYRWLAWLRDTSRCRSTLIGRPGCAVESLLGEPGTHSARDDYPLLYKTSTRNSKHSMPRDVPTEETLDEVNARFFERASTPFLAHRNSLIVDIASCAGLRRGSINSLKTSQFVGDEFVRTDRDTVLIRPERQKFSYGNVFEIPQLLHARVAKFIGEQRDQFLKSRGISAAVHEGAVFVSHRNGRPLTDGALTSLVSKAMRAAGAKKGSALHVWRAKFTVEEVENEYEERKALGIDTSADTIERAVAAKLGHKNPTSIRPYTSAHAAAKLAHGRAMRARERQAERSRLQDLLAENERLKALLAEAGRGMRGEK